VAWEAGNVCECQTLLATAYVRALARVLNRAIGNALTEDLKRYLGEALKVKQSSPPTISTSTSDH